MRLNSNSVFTGRFRGSVVSALLLLSLVACGGGSGSGGRPMGPGNESTQTGLLTLEFTDTSGRPVQSNILKPGASLVLIATVYGDSMAENPVANTVVKFSITPSTLATMSESSRLTNALGEAIVTLSPTDSLGTGVVTASTTTLGNNPTVISNSIGFASEP